MILIYQGQDKTGVKMGPECIKKVSRKDLQFHSRPETGKVSQQNSGS